jgi:hypothetical protein
MMTNNYTLIVSNEKKRKICFKIFPEIPEDSEKEKRPFMLTEEFIKEESKTLWFAFQSDFISKGVVTKEPPFPFAPRKVLNLVNTLRDYPLLLTKEVVDEKFAQSHPDWIFELEKISPSLKDSCYMEYPIFVEILQYTEDLSGCLVDEFRALSIKELV